MLRIWRRVKENRPKLPEQEVTQLHLNSPYSYLYPNAETVNLNKSYQDLAVVLKPENGYQE
jgi:hypothetical protein